MFVVVHPGQDASGRVAVHFERDAGVTAEDTGEQGGGRRRAEQRRGGRARKQARHGVKVYPVVMPTFVDHITKDIADAMRQKNQAELAPLRMLKAALMNREVEKGRALDEAESLQVVSQLVKQRRDAVDQFRAGGRPELADREQAEIVFLEKYLPPPVDEAAVRDAIEAAVQETGAAGPKDMGKVMKAVMARLAGATVDGKMVSEAVKARLK